MGLLDGLAWEKEYGCKNIGKEDKLQVQVSVEWYEKLDQERFENIVFDALKEKFIIGTRKAVNMYESLCDEVSIYDEKCKIDSNTYSMRKYVIYRLKAMNIDLS